MLGSCRWHTACLLVSTLIATPQIAAAACDRAHFHLVIDVGHTKLAYGVLSARDKPEFAFNLRLATELQSALQADGFAKSEVAVQTSSNLFTRAADINGRQPDLVLSLHHDSVQDQFLRKGEFDGRRSTYTTYASGYSIFVSRDNPRFEGSERFALTLGQALRKQGLTPNMHHSEPIRGENRPVFDAQAAVFFYDQLVILRKTMAPAVLLESAVITNREDERRAEDGAFRKTVVAAIVAATTGFCQGVSPRPHEATTQ
jgi:N-acetylmuramoyl-L-alanine amidase